jgi:hypothetical protein
MEATINYNQLQSTAFDTTLIEREKRRGGETRKGTRHLHRGPPLPHEARNRGLGMLASRCSDIVIIALLLSLVAGPTQVHTGCSENAAKTRERVFALCPLSPLPFDSILHAGMLAPSLPSPSLALGSVRECDGDGARRHQQNLHRSGNPSRDQGLTTGD